MNVSVEIGRAVEGRAEGRCEYCRMHHSLQGATFHVEHVVPRCKGGDSQRKRDFTCFLHEWIVGPIYRVKNLSRQIDELLEPTAW